MELRSQKKHPKLNSTITTNDKNGEVYLSINNTTIQVIDVSKVMESKVAAVEVAETRAGAAVTNVGKEILSLELQQKVTQVRSSNKKNYVQKMKRQRTKNKICIKFGSMRGATKETSVTPVTCDVCGKSYNNKSYLKEHKRRHEDTKGLKCTLCERRFNMKKDLGNHIKSHLKERPFSCSICDKRFTRKSLLNYHMRIHTGERPYECNICHLTFTRPFVLSQHNQRMHSSNKGRNIRCTENDCDKMFLTFTEKEMHISTWHKAVPFKCSQCHRSFSNRISLSDHKRSYHSTDEPFVCPCSGCNMKFKISWKLQTHIKSCHKDFMYKCPHCPSEFKMKSELNHHMKVSNSHKPSKK